MFYDFQKKKKEKKTITKLSNKCLEMKCFGMDGKVQCANLID